MASLSLHNVGKSYDGKTLTVSNVNAEIQDGEFVILVGPSGCGKSTLLRMIAGLETITKGEIAIDDRVINETHAKDRDIAMVFQNYALYPHMTVAENMAFGLKMRKFDRAEIERRVSEAAEVLGLTSYLERKPGALSGGQRQRVAVGRAIVRQPKLFLFDEPLSNLDAKMRVTMRAELIRLHQRLKATMVYVTHDQIEAMSMGDRLIVMKDGLVQQIGAPLEIYHQPANQFVAGFIGSPAMNFIECTIEGRGESLFAAADGFAVALPQVVAVKAGDKIVLGIRPEDLIEQADGALQARVNFLEPLGSEVIANCSLGNHEIVVRLGSRTTVRNGDAIALAIEADRVKLFDAASGKAVA